MKPRFKLIGILLFLISGESLFAQTRQVLFLGNSYTAYNNLPQLIHDAALSAGDTLVFDSNTPGGFTLENHSLTAASTNKIIAGGWDYVVLQGQSQEPIVQAPEFGLGATALENLIKQYNPCAVTMFYMTWGRKNGDASACPFFPVSCTYDGMDTTLRDKYKYVANALDAEISPVSVVWRYLRQNHPSIDLYIADESHPSLSGSYAAACCFYTTIFKKDPTLITYNGGINATDAAIIRNVAKTQVYDHLTDWNYFQLPQSTFNYTIGPGTNEIIFSPIGHNIVQTYYWDFGDGFNSNLSNPVHSYLSDGTYTITLTTTNCDLNGIYTSTSDTTIQFCSHTPSIFQSHPWLCEYDTLFTQPADSYQWYSGGLPIPVTTQYLPDYYQYPSMGFSVMTTIGGCSELSQIYNTSAEWSGYYFDAAWGGDPCVGDTALFIVMHASSTLTGSEIIHWYKDGALLPLPANTDTLFITTQGSYVCKVIDSLSHCPFDTTISSPIVFDCTMSIDELQQLTWNLYPNPSSDFITIQLNNMIEPVEISIYNTLGMLMKAELINSSDQINISSFPSGQYYIRLKNYPLIAIRFLKL